MGEQGRQRAQELYDWQTIILRYEGLWNELTEIRMITQLKNTKQKAAEILPGGGNSSKPPRWAARLDPTTSFEDYPTKHISVETRFIRVDSNLDVAMSRYKGIKSLKMFNYAELIYPLEEEVRSVLARASQEPRSGNELLESITPQRKPYVLRGLSFLTKIGLLKNV